MRRLLDFLVIAIPTLLFLILKAYSQVPFVGDENIYFYAGWATLNGVVPFREMPFAHPPLHLLIATLWMLPNTLNPLWLKLSSVLPATLTLITVLAFLRFCNVSRLVVFISGLAIATAYQFLIVSTHFTGANWSMFFLTLGLVFCLFDGRRAVFSGFALGAATLVSLHTLPMAFCIACMSCLFRQQKRYSILFNFFLSLVLVHGLCLLLFRYSYYEQMFLYHANKTPMSDGGNYTIHRFIYDSYIILAFALLGIFILIKDYILYKVIYKGFIPAGEIYIAACAVIVQFIAVYLNTRVFVYYLIPIIPFSVILMAFVLERGRLALVNVIRPEQGGGSRSNLCTQIVISLLIVCTFSVVIELSKTSFPSYERNKTVVNRFVFKPSPFLPKVLNDIVKSVAFESERHGYTMYPNVTKYLWHEINSADPSVLLPVLKKYNYVKGTIFGDASATPYLALATGRHIALEMPDTNGQLLASGVVDIKDLVSRLGKNLPAFVVVNTNMGIVGHPVFNEFLRKHDYALLANRLTAGNMLFLYGLEKGQPFDEDKSFGIVKF